MACTFSHVLGLCKSLWLSKHHAFKHINVFSAAFIGHPGYICNKEHPNQVFEFTAINDKVVTMVHKPVLAALVTSHVPFKDLFKWRLAKAKMPEQRGTVQVASQFGIAAKWLFHIAPKWYLDIGGHQESQVLEAGASWAFDQTEGPTSQRVPLHRAWWNQMANQSMEAIYHLV